MKISRDSVTSLFLYRLVPAAALLLLGSCSNNYPYADTIDRPNGRLTNKAVYVSGERYGIAPVAGVDTLKIKGGGTSNSMAEYVFDAPIVGGEYILTLEVGNYSDKILAKYSRVRLTAVPLGAARGSLIEPIKSWREDPVRGGIERWKFKFRVPHDSVHIGNRAGVAIWVPGMGKDSNISFDHLELFIYPNLRTRLSDEIDW